MKIYKLERKEDYRASYDQMRACVVYADTAGQARALAHDAEPEPDVRADWTAATRTTCRQIGWGGKQPGLILSDVWEG